MRGALARHLGKWSVVRHSGTRGVFRLVPEGFIGRVWGHVSSSESAPEGGVLRAGFRKGLPEGLPGGWHRVVRLEINGWDSSFRSDRLNCSERRWPSDSKWAAKIDSLDRAEAGIDRTGRTTERFLAVGSDVNGVDLNRGRGVCFFMAREWRRATRRRLAGELTGRATG